MLIASYWATRGNFVINMKFFVSSNERNWVLFDSIVFIGFDRVDIEPSVANLGEDDNNFVGFVLVNSELFDSDEGLGIRREEMVVCLSNFIVLHFPRLVCHCSVIFYQIKNFNICLIQQKRCIMLETAMEILIAFG